MHTGMEIGNMLHLWNIKPLSTEGKTYKNYCEELWKGANFLYRIKKDGLERRYEH